MIFIILLFWNIHIIKSVRSLFLLVALNQQKLVYSVVMGTERENITISGMKSILLTFKNAGTLYLKRRIYVLTNKGISC